MYQTCPTFLTVLSAYGELSAYSSVAATLTVVIPPKAKASVCVPAPPTVLLAVVKLETVVQVEPSYDSVAPTLDPIFPPKANAAV